MPSPRMFPMLDGVRKIPWELGVAIYEHLYNPLYGDRQSVEVIAERGGFSWDEIQLFAKDILKFGER